jgi:putative ABC transport system permease protein
MLTQILTGVFREARRHPLPFAVNAMGFSFGISIFLLVSMFARAELRYDRWIPGYERVFRIESTQNRPGTIPERTQTAPAAFAQGLKSRLPDLESVARVFGGQVTFQPNNNPLVTPVLFADASFLEIFGAKVLVGNVTEALKSPSQIVLTRTEAVRLLGRMDVVGSSLPGPMGDLIVGAVIEDWPLQSHLDVRSVLSLESPLFTQREKYLNDWGSSGGALYAKFDRPVDVKEVETRLNQVLRLVAPEDYSLGNEQTGAPPFYVMHVRAVVDLHLWGRGAGLSGRVGSPALVGALLGAALFVIFVAVANYANLATASTLRRTREIFIRRALGASRVRLMVTFLGEAIALVSLCTIIGAALAFLLQRPFQALVGQAALEWSDPTQALFLLFIPVTAGLLGGFFPAVTASRSIQGIAQVDAQRHWALKAVSIGQFAIAIFLVVVASSVVVQVRYLTTRSLGMDVESVVVYWNADNPTIQSRLRSLVQELSSVQGVTAVATSDMVPGDGKTYSVSVSRQEGTHATTFRVLNVSPEFFNVLKIRTVAGRVLERGRADDVTFDVERPISIVLNEAGTRALGFGSPQDAIQTEVRHVYGGGTWRPAIVVGVVNDFRYDQGDRPVEPLMLLHDPASASRLLVRVDPAVPDVSKRLDEQWKRFAPQVAPDRDPLPRHLSSVFDSYLRQAWAVTLAAVFAVVLAASGMYSFGALAIARRRKEIAIRRALGASQTSLYKLLAWQFTKPALLASLLAWPLGYIVVSRWLNTFHDRVNELQIILPSATLLLVGITVMSILNSTWRVVTAPPAQSLRVD